MYENPQYLTPEGFRRSKVQALRKKLRESKQKQAPGGTMPPARTPSKLKGARATAGRTGAKTISKEAAKLIAQTISLMLKDT